MGIILTACNKSSNSFCSSNSFSDLKPHGSIIRSIVFDVVMFKLTQKGQRFPEEILNLLPWQKFLYCYSNFTTFFRGTIYDKTALIRIMVMCEIRIIYIFVWYRFVAGICDDIWRRHHIMWQRFTRLLLRIFDAPYVVSLHTLLNKQSICGRFEMPWRSCVTVSKIQLKIIRLFPKMESDDQICGW